MDKTPEIKKHFIGFLVASEATGLKLLSLIWKKLMELNIPFDDCRGQSYEYNNGVNVKRINKEVQAKLLGKNPSAIYVLCGAFSQNLAASNAEAASTNR